MNMGINSKILYSLVLLSIVNIGLCQAQHVLEKKYVHMRANDTIRHRILQEEGQEWEKPNIGMNLK